MRPAAGGPKRRAPRFLLFFLIAFDFVEGRI